MTEENFDLNQGLSGKYSILKVFHDKEKMGAFLEGRVSAPIAVRLKPTNRCNHKCFYCVYESTFSGIHQNMSRRDELPKPKVMEILDDLKEMGVRAVTFSGGGEPLVHPNIVQILQRTRDNGLGYSMITNGLELAGERAEIMSGADWVRISLDYADGPMLDAIRHRKTHKGVSAFEVTAENLQNFARIKSPDCDFEANCVIHERNFDRLYDIASFLKDCGVQNVRFAPCWFPDFEKYHDRLRKTVQEQIQKAKTLVDSKFKVGSTYDKYFATNADHGQRPGRCYWMQVVPVIAADHKVYACHNKAYDPNGAVGSIKDQSFKDLWFSPQTAEFFKRFNPQQNCRHECSSHERNVLIGEWLACADPKLNRYP